MKIVQAPTLGRIGRWGNWLKQYLMCRQLAEEHGAELQTPPWPGEQVFAISHPRITDPAPIMGMEMGFQEVAALPMFFQLGPEMQPDLSKQTVQRMLPWQEEFSLDRVPVEAAIVHHRHGDFYESLHWPQVEIEVLLKAVAEHIDATPAVVSEQTVAPNPTHAHLPFLHDFQRMCRAQHLFVYPESTFSYMASRFNNNHTYLPVEYGKGTTTCRFVKE